MNFLNNYNDFLKLNEVQKSDFWKDNDNLLLQYYADKKKPGEIAKLLSDKTGRNLTATDVTKRKSYLKTRGEADSIKNTYQSYAEKWSDEDLKLLKELVDKKYTIEQISEILNMSSERVKSKLYYLSKPKKLIKDGTRKNYYIKKTTPHSKMDTKHWYYNDVKKLVQLYNQGKTSAEIGKEIGRTEGAVKDIITYYKTSLTASRFDEDWTDEEIKELESDNFVATNFAKKWQRSPIQVNNKRERVVVSMKETERLKKPITVTREISRVEKIISSIKIEPEHKIYDNVPRKHFVQEELYKSLTGVNSSILTLLGPTPQRYLNILTKYNIVGNNFIYSNEVDLNTFIKIAKATEKMNLININLSLGNIISAYPQRLIDLDLLGRWDTQNELIKTLFNKQKTYITGKKYFMFSLSVRGQENLNIPKYIQNILMELLNINKPNIETEVVTFDKSKVDKYHISNSKYDIQAYRYADTSPMISILIKY